MIIGNTGLLVSRCQMSGTRDPIDGDQIIVNEVHHPVLADPQPMVSAAVEGFRRVRIPS